MTDLRPGDPQEIAGYRVLRRLGVGGQGVVYLAAGRSGEQVAIKQLRSGQEDERARRQFAKEVSAARRVAPFCTARVVDVQLDGPSPYVVSEYIDGPSLQQQIQRHGPMSGAALQRLAVGTVTALAAIHQAGVVHRDFKPANVMLAADGPRVIDFGIARDLSTQTTVTSRVFGTPAYMAPEQLRAERVGPAADLFAWASVIAYAATGRAPFEASHMMAVVYRITAGEPDLDGVPAGLIDVLRHCLERDPARRPSAQQTLALLLGRPVPRHDVADPTQVLAQAATLVQAGPNSGAGRSPRRRRTPVFVALALLAVLAVGWGLLRGGLFGSGDGAGTGPGTAVAAPVHAGSSSADHTKAHTKARASRPATTATATASTTDPVTPTTGGTPSATGGTAGPPVVVDPPGTVAARFAGGWQGQGHQPSGVLKTWTARLTLVEGTTTGTMTLLELGCSETLTVTSVTSRVLVLDAVVDADPQGACAPRGTVWLSAVGSQQLGFLWQDRDHPKNQATGKLHRV